MQHIIFYAHASSLSYTDEKMKDITVDSETVCLWLVDRSSDCAMKSEDVCCLWLNWDFIDLFTWL